MHRRVMLGLRACSFQGPPGALTISGGYGVGETPLPIPNRAVKPHSADGTWLARARESRSPPVYFDQNAIPVGVAFGRSGWVGWAWVRQSHSLPCVADALR